MKKNVARYAALVAVIIVCAGWHALSQTERMPEAEEIMNRNSHDLLLDGAYVPDRVETATFAMGCFWGPDGLFGILPGVIRTRVGYAGGASAAPTYHDLDGHAEAIQIDFDASIVSYAELLSVFWENHDGFARPYSSQYRSIIFVHNEDQRALANGLINQAENEGRPTTEIVSYEGFTRAEGYHQKYQLQSNRILAPVLDELKLLFETFDELTDSTIAARINGYVSGRGSRARLEREVPSFGLSQDAEALLLSVVR